MKTSELTGALLDYWAAKVDGRRDPLFKHGKAWVYTDAGGYPNQFSPSTDWEQSGAIIGRVGIDIEVVRYAGENDKRPVLWLARVEVPTNDGEGFESFYQKGERPLVAAMRAYVASRFGDEVPDELSEPSPAGADKE